MYLKEDLLVITPENPIYRELAELMPAPDSMIECAPTVYRGCTCEVTVWRDPATLNFEVYTYDTEAYYGACARCGTCESSDPEAWERDVDGSILEHYCVVEPALYSAILYAVRAKSIKLHDDFLLAVEAVKKGQRDGETFIKALRIMHELAFLNPAESVEMITRLSAATYKKVETPAH